MINLPFAQRENIGFQYVLDALKPCSPYGEERVRELKPFAPTEKAELQRQLHNIQRVLAVVAPDSAPIKRVVQEARDRGMLIDASYGRKTKSVILMDTDHVILSAMTPEVLSARVSGEEAEEKEI